MKELHGGGGVETMNAYAPLDCPRPTCGRNFKSLPPPLQDHTTLSSLPIYSILDHECREGGGFSKVITSSLTLNNFSQFKKRNFKWISKNWPSCYVSLLKKLLLFLTKNGERGILWRDYKNFGFDHFFPINEKEIQLDFPEVALLLCNIKVCWRE